MGITIPGDLDEHLPATHGFDELFGILYHLNASEYEEEYDFTKDPETSNSFKPIIAPSPQKTGGKTQMMNEPIKQDAKRLPVVKQRIALMLAVFLLVVMAGFGSTVHAELPVITGENWTATDSDSKLAFLMGIATMVKAEQNLIGDPPPAGTVSYAPAMARGIGDMTLTEIMTRLDEFYAGNPDNINTAVVTAIWENIVVPNLEANK